MKLAIALHSLYWSIHTKDESKRMRNHVCFHLWYEWKRTASACADSAQYIQIHFKLNNFVMTLEISFKNNHAS